ncbi:DMSO reductase iron-sulfur subunit [Slackia heliotrinireducens]|uniref:DMSO reductase, iron-sulfur subunit n=1 Tax=Slackia heliotrinireducens (strain ATCC 29202 / DSM 20476 / NCTC 11029 / RHS 1) TaxID=471855 RepID=C7N4A8_SLAHD|nr:DMSO/selenate family reductase complex B subunit [Slackia heliotrinireducens]ACV21743.1 DMSO reductase, iron-sulfur subunit [Slackia heliotrinireducens DSM 20476]VEG99390.1 DMSO reductase iron-sulfur subunit [Slackia heliotrinireducens]
MLGFFFDNSRCTGCRTCEMACVDYNDLPAGRKYRRIIDYEGGTWIDNGDGTFSTSAFCYHISLACNHCANPECVHVCPTGAMHKNDLGLVVVNNERCVGCGYCTIACPYHAPSIDPILRQSSKCHGCSDRVAAGKRPICVEACPLRALDFGEVDDLIARHGTFDANILPLPDSKLTSPNLMVKKSPAADSEMAEEGSVVNWLEIENNHEE